MLTTDFALSLVGDFNIQEAFYLDGKNEQALLISYRTVPDSLMMYITALRKQMWIAQKIWITLQKDEFTIDSEPSKKMYNLALFNADRILLLSSDIMHRNSAIKLRMLLLPVEQLMEQYQIGKEELLVNSSLAEEDKEPLLKELLNSLLGKLKHTNPSSALKAFEEASNLGLDDGTVVSGHIYHNAGDAELKLSQGASFPEQKIEHCKKAIECWKKALEQYPANRKADRDRVQEKINQNH